MYRVMIADDEPIARRGLEILNDWGKLGCEVVYVASNGKEVIDNIENTVPDIIITDIKMPKATGVDVAKYVYEKGLDIKVILLTGYTDFSYAQSAIKYNVVDYVTKTGAFEGIEIAIKKAKKLIKEEGRKLSIQNKEAMLENFYKSIIDGSLYDKTEIEEKINTLKIENHKYSVLILNFNLSVNVDVIQKAKTQTGLVNFFKLAFKDKNPQVVPLSKNLFCIIVELEDDQEDYQTYIKTSCIDVVDMIENFMNLKVCIGISQLNNDIKQLKGAYIQAQSAINMNFLLEENKINFYSEKNRRNDIFPKKVDQLINDVYYKIKVGNTKEALENFRVLLEIQKSNNISANAIKNSGILIANKCHKSLCRLDLSISDIVQYDIGIPKTIYDCINSSEYHKIMESIITQTTDLIKHTNSEGCSLVYSCEMIIDQKLQSNITVSGIARELGVSGSYLSRVFKSKTGSTIINTINRKKVQRAKEYLSNTDMKIHEIADCLGFDNTTYFSHLFKKYTNLSPSDYKKRVNN